MNQLTPPSFKDFTRFLVKNCDRCRNSGLVPDISPPQIRCPHLRALAPLVFKSKPIPSLLAAAIDSFSAHLADGQHFTLPDVCRMFDFHGRRGTINPHKTTPDTPSIWQSSS